MICASVYLLVFIRNLLVHLAEKILLLQPLNFGGDYLGTFSHADLETDEFLLPLGRGPENDQHALGLWLHPGLQIYAIRPDVDVLTGREVAALPAVIVLLPLPGQLRDHARRQVRRILPQDCGQSLLEVACRDAAQIQDRQQRIEATRSEEHT